MRRRDHTRQLREIAGIRELQRVAAEFEAERAAAALREKDEVRKASERQRRHVEAQWLQSLSMRSLPLELTGLWSTALLREDEGVRRASLDVDGATADVERRATQLHASTMRCDTAQELACDAEKSWLNYRDEIALQDALDGHLQRGRLA